MLRLSFEGVFLPVLQSIIVIAALTFSSQRASAQVVRLTPNVSPYLNLTRSEFLRNSAFPVYQSVVRPQLERRSLLRQRAFRSRVPLNTGRAAFVLRPPVRKPLGYFTRPVGTAAKRFPGAF